MRLRTLVIAAVAVGVIVRCVSKSSDNARQKADTHDIVNPGAASKTTVKASTSANDTLDTLQPLPVAKSSTDELAHKPTGKNPIVGIWTVLKQAPASARWLSLVFLSFLTIGYWIELSGLDVTHPVRRFGAGVFLACFACLGGLAFEDWCQGIRDKRGWDTLDTNKWFRPFSFIGSVLMMGCGLLVFYVGWEGKNAALAFGIGTVVSGVVFKFGPLRLIRHNYKTIPQSSSLP